MRKPVYPVHSYPWYVHDWRQSRARLRLEPMGRYIYRELLDEAYLEGSLSDEPELLAKICDVPLKDFLKHWQAVSKNFELRDGAWHHPKVDEVLENLEKWKEQRANAGRASGRSRSTKNERSFNGRSTAVEASSSTTTTTTTTTGSVRTNDTESETETRYLAFRDAYPIDRRKDTALARQYYVQATGGLQERHDRLMAALKTYVSRTESRFVQNMERWLESPPWHLADQAPEGELRVVARDMEHLRQLIAEGKYVP